MVYLNNKLVGNYIYNKQELNIENFKNNVNNENSNDSLTTDVKSLYVEFRPILKGGSGLIDVVVNIGSIGELFVLAYKGVAYLINLFVWGVKVLVWVFSELPNPKMLIEEFGTTMTTLIFSLCMVHSKYYIIYSNILLICLIEQYLMVSGDGIKDHMIK